MEKYWNSLLEFNDSSYINNCPKALNNLLLTCRAEPEEDLYVEKKNLIFLIYFLQKDFYKIIIEFIKLVEENEKFKKDLIVNEKIKSGWLLLKEKFNKSTTFVWVNNELQLQNHSNITVSSEDSTIFNECLSFLLHLNPNNTLLKGIEITSTLDESTLENYAMNAVIVHIIHQLKIRGFISIEDGKIIILRNFNLSIQYCESTNDSKKEKLSLSTFNSFADFIIKIYALGLNSLVIEENLENIAVNLNELAEDFDCSVLYSLQEHPIVKIIDSLSATNRDKQTKTSSYSISQFMSYIAKIPGVVIDKCTLKNITNVLTPIKILPRTIWSFRGFFSRSTRYLDSKSITGYFFLTLLVSSAALPIGNNTFNARGHNIIRRSDASEECVFSIGENNYDGFCNGDIKIALSSTVEDCTGSSNTLLPGEICITNHELQLFNSDSFIANLPLPLTTKFSVFSENDAVTPSEKTLNTLSVFQESDNNIISYTSGQVREGSNSKELIQKVVIYNTNNNEYTVHDFSVSENTNLLQSISLITRFPDNNDIDEYELRLSNPQESITDDSLDSVPIIEGCPSAISITNGCTPNILIQCIKATQSIKVFSMQRINLEYTADCDQFFGIKFCSGVEDEVKFIDRTQGIILEVNGNTVISVFDYVNNRILVQKCNSGNCNVLKQITNSDHDLQDYISDHVLVPNNIAAAVEEVDINAEINDWSIVPSVTNCENRFLLMVVYNSASSTRQLYTVAFNKDDMVSGVEVKTVDQFIELQDDVSLSSNPVIYKHAHSNSTYVALQNSNQFLAISGANHQALSDITTSELTQVTECGDNTENTVVVNPTDSDNHATNSHYTAAIKPTKTDSDNHATASHSIEYSGSGDINENDEKNNNIVIYIATSLLAAISFIMHLLCCRVRTASIL